MDAFDSIRIDCLNGDKFKTGKTTPDGRPDLSIFSTPGDPVGIQVGTAIATLVRKAVHIPAESVGFRHLCGQAKLAELTDTAEAEPEALYETIEPVLPLGLPFAPTVVSQEWQEWPTLVELFPVYFCGVNTNRDKLLVDIDLERLKSRIGDYFNTDLGHDQITQLYPAAMRTTARFDARSVRDTLLKRGGPVEAGFLRYSHRPFDNRWLYWEAETKLLNEKRPDYRPHVVPGNIWLSAVPRLRKDATEPQAAVTSHISSLNLIEWGANMFPAWMRDEGLALGGDSAQRRPNLSAAAQRYLNRLGLGVEDLFHHALAVLHDPAYREANTGALRMEWPRIPLPGWPEGAAPDAADELRDSAARGRELAALLDPETPVAGVTAGTLRPELAAIAVPSTADGRDMRGDDFALTAGWGHFGTATR